MTCNYARGRGNNPFKTWPSSIFSFLGGNYPGKGYRVTFNLRLILSLILSYNNVVPQGFQPPRHLDTIASLTIRFWFQTYPPITFARQDLDGVRARISNRASLLERHLCYIARSRLYVELYIESNLLESMRVSFFRSLFFFISFYYTSLKKRKKFLEKVIANLLHFLLHASRRFTSNV